MTAPSRQGVIGPRAAAVPFVAARVVAARVVAARVVTARLVAAPAVAALAAAVALTAVAPARAATAVGVADARISTTYLMHGRIVTAVRVRGEHRGQTVTRRWTFIGLDCTGSVCSRLALRRRRGPHHVDHLMLTRVGVGSYTGRGRFTAPLRCRGRRYPHGLVVPYTITVLVTQAVPVQGVVFASQLSAVYANRRRIDHSPCPLGPSHDAARYVGAAAPLPSPPSAAFAVATQPGSDRATFTGTWARGAGGARIESRVWQFGDPSSGPANSAVVNPATHTFSAPGVYQVVLTVTDANGLTASATQAVTVPGPPTSAQGSKRIVARTALSSPTIWAGRRRAGAITA